jgi:hypothetical protein
MVSPCTDPLHQLAGKLGLTAGAEPERVQRKLLDYLGPMVRVALRHGVGQPALLRWLRQQLDEGEEPDGPWSVESGNSAPRWMVDRTLPDRDTDELVRTLARLLTSSERPARPEIETTLNA